jgi:hypothetical protein
VKGKAVPVFRSHAVQTCRKVEVEFREFLNKALWKQLSEEHHIRRFFPSVYRTAMYVGPCHHGMARPQVADGGTASYMQGNCE